MQGVTIGEVHVMEEDVGDTGLGDGELWLGHRGMSDMDFYGAMTSAAVMLHMSPEKKEASIVTPERGSSSAGGEGKRLECSPKTLMLDEMMTRIERNGSERPISAPSSSGKVISTRQARLNRNRESAKKSRLLKKAEMKRLEERNAYLIEFVNELTERNTMLKINRDKLKGERGHCRSTMCIESMLKYHDDENFA
ncbi:hypothetical protein NDN08_006388 [Rhodosorus marinus]|uniref:BZIP domain-containing protein n=1 Tax=Rhodosorus marinus TaxID=101924 RepID=A0AAV8UNB2_9RHOD|nr:hypothetical protein NDN08_006388 [Rhodosorus marinus]